MLLYAFAIILPVTFLRDISSYTWTSAIYVICFVTAVVVFVVVGIQHNVEHHFDGESVSVYSLSLFPLPSTYYPFLLQPSHLRFSNRLSGFKKLSIISFPGLISATGSICFVFVCHGILSPLLPLLPSFLFSLLSVCVRYRFSLIETIYVIQHRREYAQAHTSKMGCSVPSVHAQ